jgi:hypothetical protein
MAADGVELGLADEVCPPDAAFRNLLEKQEPEMARKRRLVLLTSLVLALRFRRGRG